VVVSVRETRRMVQQWDYCVMIDARNGVGQTCFRATRPSEEPRFWPYGAPTGTDTDAGFSAALESLGSDRWELVGWHVANRWVFKRPR